MGQKVNPHSQRIGIIHTWDSKWYAGKKDFASLFLNDLKVKKYVKNKLKSAGIHKIEIQRSAKKVTINVHAAKPGLIIGRQGVAIDDLREDLKQKFGTQFEVNIIEVTSPDTSAQLLGELVAMQIEKRIAYRRAVKMAIQKAMEAGAKGIKIQVSGRLNGVEISRTEYYKEGNIPLHTFRADIDYASLGAATTYGVIGIKVWVYKDMIFKKRNYVQEANNEAKQAA